MRIAAVIVAGGSASRMGREKGPLVVGGKTIMGRTIDCLAPQVETIAINTNDRSGLYSGMALPVFADQLTVIGTPLAGLHAGLTWAKSGDFEALLSVPSDCPFLPGDLVARLTAAPGPAAIAASGNQMHHLTGLWRVDLLPALEAGLRGGSLRRVQDWACNCAATEVAWPDLPFDPFMNVNTPEDLAEARRITAEFGA